MFIGLKKSDFNWPESGKYPNLRQDFSQCVQWNGPLYVGHIVRENNDTILEQKCVVTRAMNYLTSTNTFFPESILDPLIIDYLYSL